MPKRPPVESSEGLPVLPEDLASMVRELDASGLALPSVVGPEDDLEAPRLPLSEAEPAAVSAVDPRAFATDLSKVAQRRGVDGRRTALLAALQGQTYDPTALPDARVMLVGVLRVLVQSGVSAEALVQAILDADR